MPLVAPTKTATRPGACLARLALEMRTSLMLTMFETLIESLKAQDAGTVLDADKIRAEGVWDVYNTKRLFLYTLIEELCRMSSRTSIIEVTKKEAT